MAQQLQDSLIPRLPAVAGLDLSIGYHPSRWVGGDYADAVRMPDGRLLIAIADVCGKGLQAALVASSLHTLVHVLVEVCQSLAELVVHMDAYLCRYLPGESFVTMVLVALDVRTGELECLNLGHLPPLLVGAGGNVRPLQAGKNLALGMMPFTPQSELYRMERDEVLLLYTDGLTELENGRRPGEEPAPPDTGLLAGALGGCVQIIHSMPGADINAIRDRMSQSIRIQLDLTMASDDAAFLLARLQRAPIAPAELHGALREWATQPADTGRAAACMRVLHTFKGGARLAGAMRLGEQAHRLESQIEHRLLQEVQCVVHAELPHQYYVLRLQHLPD